MPRGLPMLALAVAAAHPLLGGLVPGTPLAADYAGGPALDTATEDVLLRYDEDLDPSLPGYAVTGSAALLVGDYGAGRVVLGAVHPEYDLHVDPGGLLPAWLVNAVSRSWPLDTFRDLREQVYTADGYDELEEAIRAAHPMAP